MTIDEYKAQPFRYDNHFRLVRIRDIWKSELNVFQRLHIRWRVARGENPDILDYL